MGNWTLVPTEPRLLRWNLEIGTYTSEGNVNENVWDIGVVYVDKSVLVGGKIFWDLNENDLPDLGEGIDLPTGISSDRDSAKM